MSQIEQGNVNITFTKLVQIAEAIEVELRDLYTIKKLFLWGKLSFRPL